MTKNSKTIINTLTNNLLFISNTLIIDYLESYTYLLFIIYNL